MWIENGLTSMIESVERLEICESVEVCLAYVCCVNQLPIRLETEDRVNNYCEAHDCLQTYLEDKEKREENHFVSCGFHVFFVDSLVNGLASDLSR
jgi:hypothetical protein